MCSLGEVEGAKDGVSVFFPKTGRFWVSLHGRKDRDDPAMGDGVTLLAYHPPVLEGFVRAYVEPLFGRWGFAESVAHVSPKNNEVLSSSSSIKKA